MSQQNELTSIVCLIAEARMMGLMSSHSLTVGDRWGESGVKLPC